MKCEKCGAENIILYRTTPKGQDPHWMCKNCMSVPTDVKELCENISKGNLSDLPEKDVYISSSSWGTCQVCGKHKDLRYGSCFACSDFVVTDNIWAWDIRSPDKKWPVIRA